MIQNVAASTKEDIEREEDINPKDILAILATPDRRLGGLIAILEKIQNRYGYLPEKALRIVGDRTGCSLVDIYGVATFYRSFHLEPRGKHLISACLGTACHVRGAPRIVEEFERQLGIRAGQTSADREFTLETVNCLGACALGPVVVIDSHYFSKVKKSIVRHLIEDALKGLDKIEIEQDQRIFPLAVSCPRCNCDLMDKTSIIDGHPSVKVDVSLDSRQGWLRMSCLYGSYHLICEFDIPEETVVNFFCPHCHEELIGRWKCPICDAPMVLMDVQNAGTVQICSRRGCKSHILDLVPSSV